MVLNRPHFYFTSYGGPSIVSPQIKWHYILQVKNLDILCVICIISHMRSRKEIVFFHHLNFQIKSEKYFVWNFGHLSLSNWNGIDFLRQMLKTAWRVSYSKVRLVNLKLHNISKFKTVKFHRRHPKVSILDETSDVCHLFQYFQNWVNSIPIVYFSEVFQ